MKRKSEFLPSLQGSWDYIYPWVPAKEHLDFLSSNIHNPVFVICLSVMIDHSLTHLVVSNELADQTTMTISQPLWVWRAKKCRRCSPLITDPPSSYFTILKNPHY